MVKGTSIVSVTSRQVFTGRGHPGIEATVVTENGGKGTAVCTAGISVGQHEVEFAYDGGTKWRGRGVQKAVDSVNNVIAPALIGVDAAKQSEVDATMLGLGGPDAKVRLGGNATAAVSAAALKAGADALGIPLYQHIGGVNACALPAPAAGVFNGSERYGGDTKRSGGKPSNEIVCYGFNTFSEASYAAWDIQTEFTGLMSKKFGLPRSGERTTIGPGVVKTDREIWSLLTETIVKRGYEGKVGLQVDVASSTYYDYDTNLYKGLFSDEPKTRDDMYEWYRRLVKEFPFVIIEDPLEENDYEGTAVLTKELGIQIVGDDLFTTNAERVAQGIALGAANTVLLKVNQIGTITEAFEMVKLAYRFGYGVMPCSSRGEGADIADYTVGLLCGTVRGGAVGDTGNRFLKIEQELGSRATFVGAQGFNGPKFPIGSR